MILPCSVSKHLLPAAWALGRQAGRSIGVIQSSGGQSQLVDRGEGQDRDQEKQGEDLGHSTVFRPRAALNTSACTAARGAAEKLHRHLRRSLLAALRAQTRGRAGRDEASGATQHQRRHRGQDDKRQGSATSTGHGPLPGWCYFFNLACLAAATAEGRNVL